MWRSPWPHQRMSLAYRSRVMVGSKPSRTVASGRRLHQWLQNDVWNTFPDLRRPALFPSLLLTAGFKREQNEAGRLHRLEPWSQTVLLWVYHSTIVSCQPFWQAVSCSRVPSFTVSSELQERNSQAPWISFVWAVSVLQWLFSQDSLPVLCVGFFHSTWEFMFFPACGKFCYSSVKEPEMYFNDDASCCTLQPDEVSSLQLIPPTCHLIPEHPEILLIFSLNGGCIQSRNL